MANENIFEPNLQITGSKRESGVITKLEINGKDIPLGAADLENNKEAAIDASTYSAPVEITPSSGKTGMKKVTVTLENIPSGGGATAYAWDYGNNVMWTGYSVAPDNTAAFETEKSLVITTANGNATGIEVLVSQYPPNTTYTKIDDSTFELVMGGTTTVRYTRNPSKDFTLWS